MTCVQWEEECLLQSLCLDFVRCEEVVEKELLFLGTEPRHRRHVGDDRFPVFDFLSVRKLMTVAFSAFSLEEVLPVTHISKRDSALAGQPSVRHGLVGTFRRVLHLIGYALAGQEDTKNGSE